MAKGLINRAAEFFTYIEEHEWGALKASLDDQFVYMGPMPDPFDKQTWLDFQFAIQAAFPDWSYNLQKLELDGNTVKVQVHITGTHTADLQLPIPGIPLLPPTGRKIEMPVEDAEIIFRGDKVSELKVHLRRHGSFPGLMEQLGLE